MGVTTEDQDRTVGELMVRHLECSVDVLAPGDGKGHGVNNGDALMVADGGDAHYLIAWDGDWGVIDLGCISCSGAGYRPQFPGLGVWCSCVKRDDDSGEMA